MAQESTTTTSAACTNGRVKSDIAIDAAGTPEAFAKLCLDLRRKVMSFLDEPTEDDTIKHTQKQTKISLQVVENALKRYRFEELSLSYNGGKDCLVLLIIILACLPTLAPQTAEPTQVSDISGSIPRLQAMYIAPSDPFTEVEDFVTVTTAQYNLNLKRYALPMRAALDAYLEDEKSVKAIFMGTRRTDPHSELLSHFSPTDAGWPQFMRVNPMLDWKYVDIWNFIQRIGVPYCALYDQGYTSLGGTSNTKPNPVLISSDGQTYRPAYELIKDEEERLGRQR